MTLQIKLENIFKNLVESGQKFGPNNKFIYLKVNNLDGSESRDDDLAKIYLGVLKFYHLLENKFKLVDLFIKIESKQSKGGLDKDSVAEQNIIYNFKFHNECVAYKYILPVLNQSFIKRNNEFGNQSLGARLSFNEEIDTAYTIAEFKNDTRYREIENINKIQHRHSWNPYYERKFSEKIFFTIRPNSNIALDKCFKYRHTSESTNDEILKLFPKFHHGEVSDDSFEDNIVVIENMLPAGFHTSNESIFLDKDRILLTLKALGKFHASSYIAKHNNYKEFTNAVNKLKATGWTLPQYWDIYTKFLDEHLQRGIKYLRNDSKYKNQVSRFETILRNPKEFFFSILGTDDKIAVICHGDFCKNNILFRYEKNREELSNKDNRLSHNDNKISIALSNTSNQGDSREGKKLDKVDVEAVQTKRELHNFVTPVNKDIQCDEVPENWKKNDIIIENSVKSKTDTPNVIIFNDKLNPVQFETSNKEIGGNEVFPSRIAIPLIGGKRDEECKNKDNSNTISYKRKEFLNQILGTNNVSDNSEIIKLQSKQEKRENVLSNTFHTGVKREPINNDIRNLNIRKIENLEFIDSKKETNKLNNKNFISTYKKICRSRPVLKYSVSLNESSSKSSSESYYEIKSNAKNESINNKNDAITDRLNYLEEKYKQLERIYNVNQCVLERRRVNMKIIEKLNEKKDILEEICKKIEKINAKQEMESKLQSSITRLYQNIDDLDIKTRTKSLPNEFRSDVQVAKTHFINKETTEAQVIMIDEFDKEIKSYDRKKDESNDYSETRSKMSYKIEKQNFNSSQSLNSKKDTDHKTYTTQNEKQKTSMRKSIDEEFDSIYKETFSKENLNEYETLFSELTKKFDVDSERNAKHMQPEDSYAVHSDKSHTYLSAKNTVESKTIERTETNIQGDSREQHNSQSEYQTLTVKQRRDNLDRSISLENELKSLENTRKGMKRSNSDINLVKLNKPPISERNITMTDQNGNDQFEKDTLKRDLLRSAFSKNKTQFFTGSPFSIDEDGEFDNDEVFEVEGSQINQNKEAKMIPPLEPHTKIREDLKRSDPSNDLKKQNSRPVPLKRTISLIHETKTDLRGFSDQSEVIKIYNQENINSGIREPKVIKKHVSMLGLNDGDIKNITSQQPVSTLTKLKTQNHEDHNQFSKANPSHSKRSITVSDSSTLPRNTRKTYFSTSEQEKKDTSTDLVFFDLARMIYTSPVIDLSFFLFLNVSHEMRIDCWDEFISAYYASIVESVPAHVQIPSRADLDEELKKKAIYGYFLCCFFLPWMMEENPRQEVDQWIHHGGEAGTEAVANILKFLIDRDFI